MIERMDIIDLGIAHSKTRLVFLRFVLVTLSIIWTSKMLFP